MTHEPGKRPQAFAIILPNVRKHLMFFLPLRRVM
jgi:hypothetical protein